METSKILLSTVLRENILRRIFTENTEGLRVHVSQRSSIQLSTAGTFGGIVVYRI